MRLAVFGMGYVGTVTAACLAARGHTVVGVDINPVKVDLVARGKSPVLEPGLGELVAEQHQAGRLSATIEPAEAVLSSDASLICVGTPSNLNGSLDAQALIRTATTIGEALETKREFHVVVVRSTVLPGSTERIVIPAIEAGAKRLLAGTIGVAVNPEFLREGSSIADFWDPPKTVVGELDARSGDVVAALYEGMPGPLFRVPIRIGEMIKYADNSFHALKIAFANEIGEAARAFGLDSFDVMEIFRADRKLNISEAYLKPGFAFGGSCLAKDLRALLYATRHADVDLPLLESVLPSNERHLQRTVDVIAATGRRRIGIVGLSFKAGTDDLRESPLVELSERLVGKGYELKIFDAAVAFSRLIGSNREYIDKHIPHLSALLVETPWELLDHSEVCVIGAADSEAVEAIARSDGRVLIDLVRLPDASERRGSEGYVGVAW